MVWLLAATQNGAMLRMLVQDNGRSLCFTCIYITFKFQVQVSIRQFAERVRASQPTHCPTRHCACLFAAVRQPLSQRLTESRPSAMKAVLLFLFWAALALQILCTHAACYDNSTSPTSLTFVMIAPEFRSEYYYKISCSGHDLKDPQTSVWLVTIAMQGTTDFACQTDCIDADGTSTWYVNLRGSNNGIGGNPFPDCYGEFPVIGARNVSGAGSNASFVSRIWLCCIFIKIWFFARLQKACSRIGQRGVG